MKRYAVTWEKTKSAMYEVLRGACIGRRGKQVL